MKKRLLAAILCLLLVLFLCACAGTTDGGFEVDQNCLIDLHLHLDGSLSLANARELADMQGIELPEDDEGLKALLQCPENCEDLNDYLRMFELPVQLLQSAEALETACYNLCEELRAEGLIYAEIRFAPQLHCQKGMTQEQAVQAVIRGAEGSALDARIILCCMRGEDNEEENLETVDLTAEYLDKGVCACDLAGAEALYPNEEFAYAFERARELEVPFTIHSGEAAGADSVRTAIEFGASRIGHGIRSAEDAEVMALLAERGIPLEVCPTSNTDTRVFDSIADMPIPLLIENGVIVTINSDDMAVSNTYVRQELQRVCDAFGYTGDEIKQLLLNSAKCAFADEETKEQLNEAINAAFG